MASIDALLGGEFIFLGSIVRYHQLAWAACSVGSVLPKVRLTWLAGDGREAFKAALGTDAPWAYNQQ